jgi:hypothetical protein
VGQLQIRSKPDGLDFGVYFLLGFNDLGIIVSNSTHGPPDSDRSPLFWWRSVRITSSLPRGVNRCVAEKKSTKTAVKSKTELKNMTPAASSRSGQSWLDTNWEDERPGVVPPLIGHTPVSSAAKSSLYWQIVAKTVGPNIHYLAGLRLLGRYASNEASYLAHQLDSRVN